VTLHRLFMALVAIGVAIACGSAPTTPSTASSTTASVASTQTAVLATIGQAVTQSTSTVVAPSGLLASTNTFECPEGGSVTTTFNVTPPSTPAGAVSLSSRLTFNACQTGSVTLQGDPYIDDSGQYTSVSNSDGSADLSITQQMTGGVSFTSSTVQGRAQYHCATVITMHYTPGATGVPSMTTTSSGSITWEQPLGSTPVTRPCGLSTP
jgi:hypothetical protein